MLQQYSFSSSQLFLVLVGFFPAVQAVALVDEQEDHQHRHQEGNKTGHRKGTSHVIVGTEGRKPTGCQQYTLRQGYNHRHCRHAENGTKDYIPRPS